VRCAFKSYGLLAAGDSTPAKHAQTARWTQTIVIKTIVISVSHIENNDLNAGTYQSLHSESRVDQSLSLLRWKL